MAQNVSVLSSTRAQRTPTAATGGSWFGLLFTCLLALGILGAVVVWQFQASYDGRMYPGVTVAGVPVGGLSPEAAAAQLRQTLHPTAREQVVLRAGDQQWAIPLSQLGATLDVETTVERAYTVGREGPWTSRPFTWWQTLREGRSIDPVVRYDSVEVDSLLAGLARDLHRAPQEARVVIVGLSVHEQPAVVGQRLDVAASAERVREAVAAGTTEPIDLVVVEEHPPIMSAEPAASQARTILAEPLQLRSRVPVWQQTADGAYTQREHEFRWAIDQTDLARMIQIVPVDTENEQREWRLQLDTSVLRTELTTIAGHVAQSPRDARFDYNPETDTLHPLVVSQPGLSMDVDAAVAGIEEALLAGRHSVDLPITVTPPRVSTADASKMNIHGAAAVGRSTFGGSPAGREQNIAVAASQFDGVVIPPRSEFSFNEYLGDVVDATGYEESYIILGDRTAVGVGGGVCQVSTTMFRAALNGGFQITERHAHGYRVSYYEPPIGLDATIYSPYVDLKFFNDTDDYYIIESDVDLAANEMAFYLYGPETGRQVEISEPEVLEVIPHGQPIYTEDPSLPQGVTEQVDWAHDGARVKVERVVRNAEGEIIHHDTFWSEYRPWVARYLVGTAPAANNSETQEQ